MDYGQVPMSSIFSETFFKLFHYIEKLISFWGIQILLQSVPMSKSYATTTSKQGRMGSKKNPKKIEKKI